MKKNAQKIYPVLLAACFALAARRTAGAAEANGGRPGLSSFPSYVCEVREESSSAGHGWKTLSTIQVGGRIAFADSGDLSGAGGDALKDYVLVLSLSMEPYYSRGEAPVPQFTFYRDPDFDTARRQMIVDWTDLKFDDEENPGIKKIPLLAPGTYTQDASKLELDCFRVH